MEQEGATQTDPSSSLPEKQEVDSQQQTNQDTASPRPALGPAEIKDVTKADVEGKHNISFYFSRSARLLYILDKSEPKEDPESAVAHQEESKEKPELPKDVTSHPLTNKWTFWYVYDMSHEERKRK
jgi:hypothetical protein